MEFIIIALIGIISSLYKRMKENNNNNNQKNRPQRTSASFPKKTVEEKPLHVPIDVQNIEKERVESIEKEYLKRKKQAEESMRALQEQKRAAQLKVQTFRNEATKSNDRSFHKADKEETAFTSTSKQTLVNGVIWSEILGPPRSKRPHSSIKGK